MFVLDVTNYEVNGTLGKKSGIVFVKTDYVIYIVPLYLNVNGVDSTLYDVIGNSGRICVTDEQGLKQISKYINESPLITTYTVINGEYIKNEPIYTYLKSISKIDVIYINRKLKYYRCYSIMNEVLFITDEDGVGTILSM